MPDRIDQHDFESVVWLQKALIRLLPGPRPMFIGQLDYMTWKAIQHYQRLHGLDPTPTAEADRTERFTPPPRTGRRVVPLSAEQQGVLRPLLEHIQQQLKAKNLTIP